MHYVDTETEALVWPQASVSGHSGRPLLDTGWDLNWPGTGRVYLDDRDIQDILSAALGRELVVEVLVGNGWTAPGDTDARVAEFEAQVAVLVAERDAAVDKAVTLEKALGWRPAGLTVASNAGIGGWVDDDERGF